MSNDLKSKASIMVCNFSLQVHGTNCVKPELIDHVYVTHVFPFWSTFAIDVLGYNTDPISDVPRFLSDSY